MGVRFFNKMVVWLMWVFVILFVVGLIMGLNKLVSGSKEDEAFRKQTSGSKKIFQLPGKDEKVSFE